MIAYLQGTLLKKDAERIILLANQVGYEVIVPGFVLDTLQSKEIGDRVELYIYYHQTERQPKPVLIGFNLEAEKEFFQFFLSVDAIGPLKATKALSIPVSDVADAIESGDVQTLKGLKGIGLRSAQKIVASLQGRVSKFALIRKTEKVEDARPIDFIQPVLDVLVSQLGHKTADAKRMVTDALKRNPAINSPESLFDEVYKGEKNQVATEKSTG